MTTNLATILATKICTALEDNRVGDAEDLAHLAVQVHSAGLSLTPLPEQEQPRVAAEVQRHPSGVEVTTTGWKVTVDGKFAGIVDALTGAFNAYVPGQPGIPHDSLDAAVSYIVAQRDSRREAEAVS